jgi:hypothetical protein
VIAEPPVPTLAERLAFCTCHYASSIANS